MKPRIHGLMYHDVVGRDRSASGFPGPGPAHYKVEWTAFREHLDRIGQAVDGPPVVVEELALDAGSRAWSLTFDDGGASSLAVGGELARRGWRAYFFVTSGRIGTSGFVDEDAIRALDAMGHVIGSHSVSHPERMSSLSREELDREWGESVGTLRDILGKDVRAASVPGGYYARPVARAAASAGIVTLFTSEPVRRAHAVDRCLVVGRFGIRADTSVEIAARVATGETGPWLRQYVAWNLRKPAKALAGDRYDALRRALLARSSRG